MALRRHPVEERERLGDLVVVPPRAVLVGEQDEPAGRVDPGVATRVLEQQEREEGLQHRLVGALGEGDPHEPHGLAGEVGAHQVRARCPGA